MSYAEQIEAANGRRSVHLQRIGELLKAFERGGRPGATLGRAGSAVGRRYQEDWQKRLRELRVLGWDDQDAPPEGGRPVACVLPVASREPVAARERDSRGDQAARARYAATE